MGKKLHDMLYRLVTGKEADSAEPVTSAEPLFSYESETAPDTAPSQSVDTSAAATSTAPIASTPPTVSVEEKPIKSLTMPKSDKVIFHMLPFKDNELGVSNRQ
jgi:hypothetical protein